MVSSSATVRTSTVRTMAAGDTTGSTGDRGATRHHRDRRKPGRYPLHFESSMRAPDASSSATYCSARAAAQGRKSAISRSVKAWRAAWRSRGRYPPRAGTLERRHRAAQLPDLCGQLALLAESNSIGSAQRRDGRSRGEQSCLVFGAKLFPCGLLDADTPRGCDSTGGGQRPRRCRPS